MAKKKSAKKPAPKSKPASKPAKKPAPKKPAASTPAYPGNPEPINTGGGTSSEEIGKQLVANFNKGKWQIDTKLWSPNLVCIEAGGMAWRGLKNVEAKNNFWSKGNTPLGGSAEGPYVGATGFAVKFRMDIKDNATGRRTIMEEIGVYTVLKGKIIQEEFMYGTMTPVEAAHPDPLGSL
jgi:hypothetical protein